MGISLGAWKYAKDLAEILVNKAQSGCKIRIMLTDPENPALPQLINTDAEDIKELYDVIKVNFDYYSRIAQKHENIATKLIQNGCPTYTVYLTDEYAMYMPYFHSVGTAYGPLWKCKRGSKLYELLSNDFETIWNRNSGSD